MAAPGTIRIPVEVSTTVKDTFASDQAHVAEISRLNPDELAGYLSTQTVEEVERFLTLSRDVATEHRYRGEQADTVAERVRRRMREILGDEGTDTMSNPTAPHLHIGLSQDGQPVDPQPKRMLDVENAPATPASFKPERPLGMPMGRPPVTGNGLIPTEQSMAEAAQERRREASIPRTGFLPPYDR